MIDAVLLDWEGTLADTAVLRRDALLRALAEEGMPVDPIAYHTLCDGRAVRDAAANMLAHSGRRDPTITELVALRANRAFSERIGTGFILLHGAREFVERIQLGTRVAIVTSASRAETDFMLRLAGLENAVATIVTADDGGAPLPAPDLYQRALAQLRRSRPVSAARVIAMASSTAALRAARAAGTRTVAVRAPAHIGVEADAAVDGVHGLSLSELSRLAGIVMTELGS